jgi:hypothetical protein
VLVAVAVTLALGYLGLRVSGALQGPPPAIRTVSGVSNAPWAAEFVDADGAHPGQPARWDPCTPIHYVVSLRYAPPTGRSDLQEALRRLTVASGLTFVDDGQTREQPTADRPAYDPHRWGQHWAPVLIAWVPPGSTNIDLEGDREGVTLPIAVPNRGGGSIVTAQVLFNSALQLPSGFGPGPNEGFVMLHELGHAVGLGHVADPRQVMYPEVMGQSGSYGAGDLAGLHALGRAAGCHPAPTPRALHKPHP